MSRPFPRSPQSTFFFGTLALVVLLSLLFLAVGKGSTDGVLPTFLRSSNGRFSSPSAMVLKGEMEGLNWPSRLMEDQFYFIAGAGGGVTNQVVTLANMIYIALLSSRVPIVPSIYGYAGQLGGPLVTSPLLDLPFSSMFDLPRLFDHLHREHGLAGIIEWKDLVNVTKGDAYDKWNATSDWVDISCWNAFVPPFQDPMRTHRLNPTFSPLPPPTTPPRGGISIPTLTSYLHPDSPIIQPYLQAINGTVASLPSTKIACVDNLYYASVSIFVSNEWAGEAGFEVGAWPAVGRHMHWNPELRARGETVRRWLFGVSEWEEPVDFISVHIRHGDFLGSCPLSTPDSDIVPLCRSSDQYAYAVASMQSAILRQTGKTIKEVFVATDETDALFLHELTVVRRWKLVDEQLSLRIRRDWGDWHPTLIDKVLLSMGKGFVGTYSSTMSIASARRVEDWNGGPPSIYVNRNSPVGDDVPL
ncbi:hypothetical protein BDY24DRAFT_418231 [Mrakia frigida]|uniref:O-fucosyltransferase family protein n=1 Tax=Mrakia frigida TaxID=29902 RepID=UPI003FCBFB7A